MKAALFAIAVFVSLWMCLVPDGRTLPQVNEPEQETLYASHHCESGRWYFETSDADSVTVACFPADPPDPEN